MHKAHVVSRCGGSHIVHILCDWACHHHDWTKGIQAISGKCLKDPTTHPWHFVCEMFCIYPGSDWLTAIAKHWWQKIKINILNWFICINLNIGVSQLICLDLLAWLTGWPAMMNAMMFPGMARPPVTRPASRPPGRSTSNTVSALPVGRIDNAAAVLTARPEWRPPQQETAQDAVSRFKMYYVAWISLDYRFAWSFIKYAGNSLDMSWQILDVCFIRLHHHDHWMHLWFSCHEAQHVFSSLHFSIRTGLVFDGCEDTASTLQDDCCVFWICSHVSIISNGSHHIPCQAYSPWGWCIFARQN